MFSKIALVLILIILFPFPSSITSAHQNANDPVTIRVLVGLHFDVSLEMEAIFDQIAAEFNNFHDDLKLEFSIVARSDANTVLLTQIEAGTPYDIIGPTDILGISAYNELWIDLTPYMNTSNENWFDFPQPALEVFVNQGVQVALPNGLFPSMIFYNKAIFDAAGLDAPPHEFGSEIWTFDTLRDMAMELTLDTNEFTALDPEFYPTQTIQWGYSDSNAGLRALMASWGAGHAGISEDGHVMLVNDPIWIDALTWYEDGMYMHHFIPDGSDEATLWAMGIDDLFSSGQIAMFNGHTWFMDDLETAFEWDIAATPMSPNGKVIARLHANGYAISNASTQKEAAFEVLQWLLSPEVMVQLCAPEMFDCIAARQSVWNIEREKLEILYPNIDHDVIFNAISYADIPNHQSWLPNFVENDGIIEQKTDVLYENELGDPTEFLNKVQMDTQSLVDNYWEEANIP